MSCLDILEVLTLYNLGYMIQTCKLNISVTGPGTITAKLRLPGGSAGSLFLFFANEEPKETS